MLAAVVAVALSAALFLRFVMLERSGRPLRVVLWLLGLLVVEAALWANPNDEPTGVFHPDLGSTNFRLVDTVVLAAIAARVVGRRGTLRLGPAALAWWAFLLWLGACAVVGAVAGNDVTAILFQAKALAYLGVLCVASGVRPADWRDPAIDRLLVATGAFAALLVVIDQSGTYLSFALPLLSVQSFGEIGSDLATVLVVLGLLSLGRATAGGPHRLLLLCATAPMFVATLLAGQRAALIGLVLGLLVLGLLTARSGGSLRLPGGELVVVGLVVSGLLVVPLLLSAGGGGHRADPLAPVVVTVGNTLDSQGKQLSAAGRVNQYREVRPLLAQKPVLGWGLGRTYSYYEPGPREFIVSGLTHNIGSDLLLRTGLVGLVLFAAAVGLTAAQALASLRRTLDPVVAAGTIALLGGVAGWLGKGMVESLFEKYRLAVVLGIGIGLLLGLSRRGAGADDESGVLDAQEPDPYRRTRGAPT